ncbi:very short patch repair endonuclease [Rhodopseudomonas palustris]|uniref:very short patch repair endonuclease n=1 Tax=Rhodopseudomonas palustris TaxID=1076 RepID=UPI0024C874A2|nr:very short patch repair endonuclease [Rhodopseudomonas palustris]UYO46229.1 very short patch repair endonuclease [Rhodopseudomonas palustris]
MTDVFSKQKRSEIMARVKGRGNAATELRLIAIFREHGITGWRRRRPVFGNPDFVFPAARLAVFVDGCFWHGCPVHGSIPKTNEAFWREKLERNRARDRAVMRRLRKLGWNPLRIWQHDLGDSSRLVRRLRRYLGAR